MGNAQGSKLEGLNVNIAYRMVSELAQLTKLEDVQRAKNSDDNPCSSHMLHG